MKFSDFLKENTDSLNEGVGNTSALVKKIAKNSVTMAGMTKILIYHLI